MPALKYAKSPTAEQVRQVLDYDPVAGDFVWRHRLDVPPEWNTKFSGKRAGNIRMPHGYRVICIGYRKFYAHRLAWLLMNNTIPGLIDHVNGDTADNRIVNLRSASFAQNQQNQRKAKHNTSGYKGVRLEKRSRAWVATINVNRRPIYLGSFKTPEQAHVAYCDAATRLFGEFARAA